MNHESPCVTLLNDGSVPLPRKTSHMPYYGVIGGPIPTKGNYKGVLPNPVSLPTRFIPASQNTSVFMSGLPAKMNTTTLMAGIAPAKPGAVFQTHIIPPEPRRRVRTSAAKVTFFTPQAAQAFLKHAKDPGVFVGGQRALVVPNRHPVGPQASSGESRVLFIRGHKSIINPEKLRAFFRRQKFTFQTETVIDHTRPGSFFGNVEWRFGSYYMQAELAYKFLQQGDGEFGVVAVGH
ncbi:hypothetical protein F4779DRAFT_621026 [Xylariaceae sp. FL0662B]|nr:hypothetical protein F4779DRAFT_621026 [Xylariaceae sp. FL0662B]